MRTCLHISGIHGVAGCGSMHLQPLFWRCLGKRQVDSGVLLAASLAQQGAPASARGPVSNDKTENDRNTLVVGFWLPHAQARVSAPRVSTPRVRTPRVSIPRVRTPCVSIQSHRPPKETIPVRKGSPGARCDGIPARLPTPG